MLLDAWQEHYEVPNLRVLEGHVPARSGDAFLGMLAERLTHEGVPYAATSLAAAWMMTRLAAGRIVRA